MDTLRVMSFNVRQIDGDDGAHAWEHRREVLAETVKMYSPMLLGTQETYQEQVEFLLERIPDFACFGRGRYGDDRDKHCKVFYDRQFFTLLECGEMWFSETPDLPGSSAWGIPKPRMLSWGHLRSLKGRDVLLFNTHLPYGRGADEARRESARIILERLADLPQDIPLIFTGDFNAPVGGEIYQMFKGEFLDAWTTAEQRIGPEGTLHGFGRITDPQMRPRIDWILHRNIENPLSVETCTHTAQGIYPSDHYPVIATFASIKPSRA